MDSSEAIELLRDEAKRCAVQCYRCEVVGRGIVAARNIYRARVATEEGLVALCDLCSRVANDGELQDEMGQLLDTEYIAEVEQPEWITLASAALGIDLIASVDPSALN